MASPPVDRGPQAEGHSEDDTTTSSPSQSQGPEPSEGLLRSIPTFVEGKCEDGPATTGDGDGEGNGNAASHAATAPSSPGFIDKIMQKLGLNSLILMNMFKCVPNALRVSDVDQSYQLTSAVFCFLGHPLRRPSP